MDKHITGLVCSAHCHSVLIDCLYRFLERPMAIRNSVPRPKAASTSKTAASSARRVKPASVTSGEASRVSVATDLPKGRNKLVRDSFTIPKGEYAVLIDLKQRAASLGQLTKKSELLRAGITALNAMTDRAFLAAVVAVPSLKTGRPKKERPAVEKRAATRS